MSAVGDLQVSYAHIPRATRKRGTGLLARLEQQTLLVIAVLVLAGFALRVYKLDAAGLAEDETNKLFAVRAYQQGDFTVNAEHPMLLKLLCYASMRSASAWTDLVGEGSVLAIPEEAALRLPNAFFGALTVVPLALLATGLLGFRVGLISGMLWVFGLNSIWFNRIAKEDTLVIFFILTGFYLYNLAKERPERDLRGQASLYALSGAAFGLMLCAKYFPHFFGFNLLFYHLAGYDKRNNRPLTRAMYTRLYGGMLVAFVAFNPALFAPQTWRYLSRFLSEDLITHHGYLVMDRLFLNDMSQTPGGNAWYIYLLYFAVKVPLPLLFAFLAGLVEVFRHRGEPDAARGYLFLRMVLVFWFLPMALVGSKFLRYTLPLMPFVYMTAAVGVVKLWELLSEVARRTRLGWRRASQLAGAFVSVVFVAAPAVITLRNMPHPSLYVNGFGQGRAGYFFPHDEFYDVGARESIKYVADNAAQGARLASEIPGVVQYYLERFNRTDIRSEIMSHPKFSLGEAQPDYVLLQRGRLYLENRGDFSFIENSSPRVQTSRIGGAVASELYKTDGTFGSASLVQPSTADKP